MSVLLRRYYQLLINQNFLTDITKAAILAAFGQTDGGAVIKATNAYLNALAVTDPTKATALMGALNTYVHEDAHIVYSLVPTLGVMRWLVGDGKAYICTSYYANTKTDFDTTFRIVGYSTSNIGLVGGTSQSNTNPFDIFLWENDITVPYGGENKYKVSNVNNILRLTKDSKGRIIYYENDVVKKDDTYGVVTYTSKVPTCLFCLNRNGRISYISSNMFATFIVSEEGQNDLWLVPFIRNGENGMLDILGGTFYHNVNYSGSFTIKYTLPDGTPWTPTTLIS